MYTGFVGGVVVFGYMYSKRPDHRCVSSHLERRWDFRGLVGDGRLISFLFYEMFYRPTVWARVEAERRLEERGESFGWPFPPNYRKDKTVSREVRRDRDPTRDADNVSRRLTGRERVPVVVKL